MKKTESYIHEKFKAIVAVGRPVDLIFAKSLVKKVRRYNAEERSLMYDLQQCSWIPDVFCSQRFIEQASV